MSEHFSSSLSHYFAKMSGVGEALSSVKHVASGAECVSLGDVTSCIRSLPAILEKVSELAPDNNFRRQVECLALFLAETPAEAYRQASLRESVFVLFYLLNARDLIPDHIPEFGLLDDAYLVDTAYNRNLEELRAHWSARNRAWPAV